MPSALMKEPLSKEDRRKGYLSWFNHEFKYMIEKGIDEYLWDDHKALRKAYLLADWFLQEIRKDDPPVVDIEIKHSIVHVHLYWPKETK